MGWYGKLIGAVLGAIIGRGLLGAIVGLLIGHQFDRRLKPAAVGAPADPRRLRDRFFRATFRVMGHVAKADGRVTEQEIDAARAAMRRFSRTRRRCNRPSGSLARASATISSSRTCSPSCAPWRPVAKTSAGCSCRSSSKRRCRVGD